MQWSIDTAHSQIQFSVRHMGLSNVRGTFDKFDGSITEENGVVTAVTVEIDVSSVNTNQSQRDDHLRSGDFFDVGSHPHATFVLTNFEKSGEDVTATGNLTIRGATHPVTLKGEINGPAKDPWGNQKVSATLEGKISRKEWGLVYNAVLETGGMLLGDDVKLVIDVQAAVAATPAAV